MMVIELIRIGNKLVPRRHQDRWNLGWFKITEFDMRNIRHQMKAFRKMTGGDFILDVVQGDMEGMTLAEYHLLTGDRKVA